MYMKLNEYNFLNSHNYRIRTMRIVNTNMHYSEGD